MATAAALLFLLTAVACVILLAVEQRTKWEQVALGAVIGIMVAAAVNTFVGGLPVAIIAPVLAALIVIALGTFAVDRYVQRRG